MEKIFIAFISGIIMISSLAGCLEKESKAEETAAIGYDQSCAIICKLKSNGEIDFSGKVITGGEVDFMLFDEKGYNEYNSSTSGSNKFYSKGTKLNAMEFSFNIEVEKGDWYIVIDNTNLKPDNGAKPLGDVTVYYTVAYGEKTSSTQILTWILISTMIAIVAIISWQFLKKREE